MVAWRIGCTIRNASSSSRMIASTTQRRAMPGHYSAQLAAPRVHSLLECNADFNSTLGVGSCGIVYPGSHQAMFSKLAVKASKADRKSMILARQERQAYMRILESESMHPNVVDLFGCFEGPRPDGVTYRAETADAAQYFVMQQLEGDSLDKRIRERNGFCERDAQVTTRSLLKGLRFLHEQGVVHRDVKPTNVLYSSSAVDCEPQFIDFSHAGVVPDGASLATNIFKQKLGTLGYAAPEVMAMDKTYSAKCDIYSLGCTVYAMLTNGSPPSADESSGDVSAQMSRFVSAMCSPAAGRFLADLLTADPDARPNASIALAHPWLMEVA